MKLADAQQRQDLYPDRYLNVFVPYRAHLLDYNVTRALVATLRWSRPEVTRDFLQEVAGVEAGPGAYHYDLQACDYEDFDPASVPRRVVLGVSIGGELATRLPALDEDGRSDLLRRLLRAPGPDEVKLEQLRQILARPEVDADDMYCLAHTLDELADGCLPDGWIFSADAGVCLLMEAKLLRRLDLFQLQRYAAVYFGSELAPQDVTLVTWEQIAAFFAARREDEDPRTAFLCGQLHDYLDLLGLAPFNGFKPYDMDVDTMHEALPKFLKFVQAVREEGIAKGLPLGAPRGSVTGARVPFSADDLLGELRLDLRESGIHVELCLGDAPGGAYPGRAALDRLLERSRDGEHNPLAGQQGEGLRLRIERLRQDRAGGEVFFDRETANVPFDADAFGETLAELRLQHPPAAQARGAAGEVRQGLLAIGTDIARRDALSPARSLVDLTREAVTRLTRLARSLTEGLQGETETAPAEAVARAE